jgi:long-subunit fatty acid transport protein
MGTGHMCDPAAYGLRYAINPSWELGFGIGYVYGDNVQLNFVRISPEYTCVVDGRLFKG